MTTVFLGISFIILAILNWFGNPYVISKKYRNLEFIKEYQKGMALPYTVLGIGFVVWGLAHNTVEEQDTLWFSAGVILIAIVPLILLWRNRRKFNF